MTPRDFCYWLQGHFEIGGETAAALSALQVEMIKKHLELSFKSEYDRARQPDAIVGSEFCDWLQGFVEGADSGKGLDCAQTGKIRERLSNVFVHKIDPTFRNRSELQDIHRGGKADPPPRTGQIEAMC